MLLTVNKRVKIRNPRLNAVYYVLLFITVACFALKVLLVREYGRTVDMADYVKATMWVNKASVTKMDAIWEQKSQDPLCASPRDYDYWWDSSQEWTYENHSCLPLCQNGMSRHECISPYELSVLEGQSQVFLVTQMQETFLHPGEDLQKGKTNYYFIPFAEAMSVSLTYSYDMPEPKDSYLLDRGGSRTGASTENIRTILVDSAGQHYKTIDPSDSVSLSATELLDLAGDPNVLDTTQPAAGSNKLPSATHAEGPIARITGLELVVDIECSNPLMLIDFRDKEDQVPTCYMSVHIGRQVWSAAEQLDTMAGGTRHRHLHGMRIRCRTKGSIETLDMTLLLQNLIAFMVIVRIPKVAVELFMYHCLGHLSKIYHQVVYEMFSLPAEISSIATRLMAAGVSFVGLADDASRGISKKRLQERLRAALDKEAALDKDEVQQFVDFVFQGLTNKQTFSQFSTVADYRSFFREMKIQKGNRSSPTSDQSSIKGAIDVDDYSVAFCSGERVGFEDVVQLFDTDRKMHFFERYFMPSSMRDCILKSRSNAAGCKEQSCNGDHSNVQITIKANPAVTSKASTGSDHDTSQASLPSEARCPMPKAKAIGKTMLASRVLALTSVPSGDDFIHNEDDLLHNADGKVMPKVEQELNFVSALPFDPEEGMTLEEEKHVFRMMIRGVRALSERDIQRTAEMHHCLLNFEALQGSLQLIRKQILDSVQQNSALICQLQEDVASQRMYVGLDEIQTEPKQTNLRVQLDRFTEELAAHSQIVSSVEQSYEAKYGELAYKLDILGAKIQQDDKRTKTIEKELEAQQRLSCPSR